MHGALGSKAQLQSLKALLQDNFRIFELNFGGHGGKASQEPFSIQRFTEEVAAFLDQQEVKQIHIFGYSMGGYVALNLARLHPDRVGKIATLGTKLNWTEESAQKEVRMLNPAKILEKVPAYADHLQSVHAPLSWQGVLEQTAGLMLGMGSGKRLFDKDFQSIPHEVRMAVGDKDRMVSIEETQHVVNQLPNASLHVMEGFPHPIDKVDIGQLGTWLAEYFNKA